MNFDELPELVNKSYEEDEETAILYVRGVQKLFDEGKINKEDSLNRLRPLGDFFEKRRALKKTKKAERK